MYSMSRYDIQRVLQKVIVISMALLTSWYLHVKGPAANRKEPLFSQQFSIVWDHVRRELAFLKDIIVVP